MFQIVNGVFSFRLGVFGVNGYGNLAQELPKGLQESVEFEGQG